MSVRQIGKGAAQIPSNAELLEFPRTDGRKKEWPSNTEKVVDSAGAVNYMSAQTIDNAPSPIWRKNAGQKVAAALKLPGGEHSVYADLCNADASVAEDGSKVYVLKDWPEGYRMFIHLKGPEQRPRNDPYLYGMLTFTSDI